MTKQRTTRCFRGNALLALWVCGVILVPGVIVPIAMARAPTATASVSTATASVPAVDGLTGLRIEEAGLVEKFAPTLPKSLSYLRLVNLMFRGKAPDVVISRLPSGRVVRRVTVKSAGH